MTVSMPFPKAPMTSAAIQDCRKWLGDTLQALKLRALPSRASVSDMSQEGPSSTSLLETFCDGDLQQAELILNSSLESASVGTRDQLSLVRPVIPQLENDWRAGQRSYTDTVYAFWNVEQLLSRLESQRPSQTRPKGSAWGRVLLAAAPETQHVFGLSVVGDSFRAAGWDTQTFTNDHPDGIVRAATDWSADFIGLSVGYDEGLLDLGQFISLLRQKSRNPSVKIILGGNVFSSPRTQYEWLGADYIALSVEDALGYCSGTTTVELSRN
jgi:methanogenic corrinoid protein MtbC1